ncbi:SPASM domain-containing protein [Enterovibrio coralii]|uniref:4Fe4S-binding SPASM domain-containing protein n=1 Tax=Enterovibrio coralii TaxID=294935 RepID=A0A135I6M1_9GAMM|nr:SPASM domain-containing protein [Enterovibrio coralii]KXF81057.1 hypothetical protein ATN88_18975 [Enterovibrio coralii]
MDISITEDEVNVVNVLNNEPMLCKVPFNQILVTPNADVYLCCGSHIINMPPSAGNLLRKSGREIWNNEIYKKFRMSFADGSFRYCNTKTCSAAAKRHDPSSRFMIHTVSEIENDETLRDSNFQDYIDAPESFDGSLRGMPTRLYLGMDNSCNLKCPSCREKLIIEDHRNGRLDKLYENLRSITKAVEYLEIDGAGDVFASSWYQRFLKNFPTEDFPNLKEIGFRSNGLLWTKKNWYRIHPYFRSKMINALISVDATTEETYKKVRGGCFHSLMENLDFIHYLLKNKEINCINLIMVYRKSNYKEIPQFIELGKRLSASYIVINPLQAWEESAYVINGQYDDEAIHLPTHPEHDAFKDCLNTHGVKNGKDGEMYVDFSW